MSLKKVQSQYCCGQCHTTVQTDSSTVSDRVQKEGLKTNADDTTSISIQYRQLLSISQLLAFKTRCFRSICQLGALTNKPAQLNRRCGALQHNSDDTRRQHNFLEQENLANAKVSARQQCVYEGPQRRNVGLWQINARNTMLNSIFGGLQRCR